MTGLWGLVQATVGALIAFRRPENRLGRLLQISGPLRWRRGSRAERSQLKWLFAALVVAAILFPHTFGAASLDEAPNILAVLSVGSALLIPVAIGIAILRYRLFEIDRLISRTIGWAIVTGLVGTAFALGLVALQAVLGGFTQGQTLAVAACTLAAFALFQPVRRRVQSAVDRRFDWSRYDAQRTVDAFGQRLRDETNMEKVTSDLSRTAGSTLAPSSLMIWIRAGSNGR